MLRGMCVLEGSLRRGIGAGRRSRCTACAVGEWERGFLRLVRGGSIAVMSGLRRYRCGAGRCSAFSATFPKRSRGKAGGGKWRAVSVRGGRGFRGGGCGFSVLSAGAAREFRRVSISPGEPELLGGGCRGWGKALLICAGGSYVLFGVDIVRAAAGEVGGK